MDRPAHRNLFLRVTNLSEVAHPAAVEWIAMDSRVTRGDTLHYVGPRPGWAHCVYDYTAAEMNRLRWRDMYQHSPTPGVFYRAYRLATPVSPASHYAIVFSELADNTVDFRVLNLQTAEESALYSFDQCQAIIGHAQRDELAGNFGLPVS